MAVIFASGGKLAAHCLQCNGLIALINENVLRQHHFVDVRLLLCDLTFIS